MLFSDLFNVIAARLGNYNAECFWTDEFVVALHDYPGCQKEESRMIIDILTPNSSLALLFYSKICISISESVR
jgi:hypothetical protein